MASVISDEEFKALHNALPDKQMDHPGQSCIFPDGPAPMVNDNGVHRRVVHSGRYAASLSAEERAAFWENAVERYLTTELALMDVVDAGRVPEAGDRHV